MLLFPLFDAYSALVLLASFVSLLLAAYSWFGIRREVSRPFSFLQLSAFLWSFFTYLGLRVESPLVCFFYLRLEYFGVIALPLCCFAFARALSRKPLGVRELALLSIIPLLSVLLVASSYANSYFWRDPRLGLEPFLRAQRGPWFYVHTAYSYLLLVASFIVLLRKALSLEGFVRRFIFHMRDLTARLGTAVILITHSLGVVAGMCDTICVMYAGRIVERGATTDIFNEPKHPYTQGLIKSVPRLDKASGERLFSIRGQPPNVIDLPDCCPFYPRCDKAQSICKRKYPATTDFGKGRAVACWLYTEAK